MKKIFLMTAICIMCFLSGCSNSDYSTTPAGPTATVPPGITKPKGAMYDSNPPMMEGIVTSLTKDKIIISVEGKNWDFYLSDRAKEELGIYKEKFETPIVPGSFIQIKYEKLANGLTANNISFVTAN